jgi:hypothetical protein
MKETFPPESWPSVQENKLKRNEYFHMLRKLKDDFLRATINAKESPTDFGKYVEEITGLRMHFAGSMITEHYTVVDEEKFFLFTLKR